MQLAGASPPREFDTAMALVALLILLLALAGAVVRGLLRRRDRRTRATRALAELGTRPLYCFCGQPATRPASRTGEPTLMDDIFPAWRRLNLRAQYQPAIPIDGIPTLCDLHGRTWDAKLRLKAVEVIDLALANLHRECAERMASYEGGDLAIEMEQTLTKAQRAERTRLVSNRSKFDGVEKAVIVSPAAFAPGGIAPEPVLDGVPPQMQVSTPTPTPGVDASTGGSAS